MILCKLKSRGTGIVNFRCSYFRCPSCMNNKPYKDLEFVIGSMSSYQQQGGVENSLFQKVIIPRDSTLNLFTIISYLTTVASLLVGFAQGFDILYKCIIIASFNRNSLSSTQLIIQLYITAFTIAIVLCELEYEFIKTYVSILQNWTIRGLFYIFISLLSVNSSSDSNTRPSWRFAMDFASYSLLVMGVVYTFMVGYDV